MNKKIKKIKRYLPLPSSVPLFIIIKMQNPSKYPTRNEWTKKMCNLYVIEYYSALTRKRERWSVFNNMNQTEGHYIR
jgi:hypothetical protein